MKNKKNQLDAICSTRSKSSKMMIDDWKILELSGNGRSRRETRR